MIYKSGWSCCIFTKFAHPDGKWFTQTAKSIPRMGKRQPIRTPVKVYRKVAVEKMAVRFILSPEESQMKEHLYKNCRV